MIKVIKESERGALLITNGERIAWVMGHQMRKDGSFTKGALEALANGKTIEEHEAEQAAWKAARERKFQDGKAPASVSIADERITDYSEKAWKVRTDEHQYLYGRWCWCYEYLPKSMVSVKRDANLATLTMPKWFLEKHKWLSNLH